eukprot:768153-Hanusia_phi.AAC.2
MRSLQARVHRMQLLVMAIAMAGLLIGISINEYCWLGYIPTLAEEKGSCSDASLVNQLNCTSAGYAWSSGITNPVTGPGGQRCRDHDSGATALKVLCTIFTCTLIVAIFRMYETIATEICFRNHLEYHRQYADIPFWNLGLLYEFALEVLFCIVHPAPGIRFNITIQARGRNSVYNIESVLVAVMFLRMYTVWRYFRTWMFLRYSAKNFASRMTEVVMDSKLAVKAILADVPFETLAGCFVVMLFTLAYLLRIAEAPVREVTSLPWPSLTLPAGQLGAGLLLEPTLAYPGGDDVHRIRRLVSYHALWKRSMRVCDAGRRHFDSHPDHHCCEKIRVEHFGISSDDFLGEVCSIVLIESFCNSLLVPQRATREASDTSITDAQNSDSEFVSKALRQFKNRKKAYRKFLESTPHFGAFVENMKEGTEQVNKTLQKIEKAVSVPNLDLGRVGQTQNQVAKGSAAGAVGGQPMSSQAFEELLHEIMQASRRVAGCERLTVSSS